MEFFELEQEISLNKFYNIDFKCRQVCSYYLVSYNTLNVHFIPMDFLKLDQEMNINKFNNINFLYRQGVFKSFGLLQHLDETSHTKVIQLVSNGVKFKTRASQTNLNYFTKEKGK